MDHFQERTEYDGNLNSNIKLENFSKEVLVNLIKAYSYLYYSIDGFWFVSVMNKVNHDMALDCDIWVWKKQAKFELDRISKLLNIQGKDVEAFLKTFQFFPWSWSQKYNMEIKNKDWGIVTVFECPTVSALEKEGKGRDYTHCANVEPVMFQAYADYFNPHIEVKPIKLPPRLSKEDICCQWEFKLKKN